MGALMGAVYFCALITALLVAVTALVIVDAIGFRILLTFAGVYDTTPRDIAIAREGILYQPGGLQRFNYTIRNAEVISGEISVLAIRTAQITGNPRNNRAQDFYVYPDPKRDWKPKRKRWRGGSRAEISLERVFFEKSDENRRGLASVASIMKEVLFPRPFRSVSRSDSSSTPTIPGSSGLSIPSSIAGQDLSHDKFIHAAPRMTFLASGRFPVFGRDCVLLAKIGQGGMGAVYYGDPSSACGRRSRSKFCLSIWRSAIPRRCSGFYREAQFAARVKSPNLVGVLDVNEEAGIFIW